jgi:hypothetical protein
LTEILATYWQGVKVNALIEKSHGRQFGRRRSVLSRWTSGGHSCMRWPTRLQSQICLLQCLAPWIAGMCRLLQYAARGIERGLHLQVNGVACATQKLLIFLRLATV